MGRNLDKTGRLSLAKLLAPRERRQAAVLLALMLIGGIAELSTIGAVVPFLAVLADPLALRRFPAVIELLSAVGASTRWQQLQALTVLFVSATLFAASLRLMLSWATQRFSMRIGHHLACEVHRRTLLQPYEWHVSNRSSETIAGLEQVQQLLFSVILPLLQGLAAGLIGVFIIAALIAVDPLSAVVAAAAFASLYTAISLLTRRRIARDAAIIGKAQEERVRLVQEGLGGIRDIIIDGSQASYHSAFSRVDLRLNKARARLNVAAQAPRFVIEALGMVAIAALALLLATRAGGLAAALPVLGALALGAQRLLPLVQQIYQSWTYLSGYRGVIADIGRQLLLPLPAPVPETGEPLPFRQALELRDISYRYPTRSLQVLEGVNLTIRKGSRVALVGRTGSGKSTLADLIMGLIEPGSGAVLIDGTRLTTENRRAWQRNIAHVSQAIFLADASIARNIAFGGGPAEPDFEKVRFAAKAAALDEFVMTLPDGYATPVGERGVQLSGGQRQRLGLARAFYKGSPFLVLDEATSALDPETESSILRSLDGFIQRGGTLLLIAHRSTSTAGCDMVVRLEGGQVVRLDLPGTKREETAGV